MVAYLRDVWRCRYFWASLVLMDLRSRYRGSVLGLGWSLVHPIAMTAIICTAFGTLFNADLTFYAPFLMAGLTCWTYLLNVAQLGAQCFFQGEPYIRQYPTPLAIYPLRTTLGNAFHYSLALGLVVALASALRGFPGPWALLSLAPTFALLLLLGWALATCFGLLNVCFRDTSHASELAFQTLFYLTPVLYEPDLLIRRGLGALLWCNPVVPFLDLLRQPLLYGTVPALPAYGSAAGVVLVAVGAASLLLWHQERRLIFLL